MDLFLRSHTFLFFLLRTALPSSPPDFLNAFRESFLAIAKEGRGDLIDLSAKGPCYDGLVSFGKVSTFTSQESQESCDANSTSLVSCVLTDGSAFANLTLKIFDDCRKIPMSLQEPRQLHLAIWVPILGVIILGMVIGLAVFAFMKISQKCKNEKESQNFKSSYQPNYDYILDAERACSISSAETDISVISNSPSISKTLNFCPNLYPSRADSAFSSMKTLGTILEDDDSISEENFDQDLKSESCRDLKIFYSRSTTTLSDVVFLDVDEFNNESSTDASLRRPKESKPVEKDEENTVE